MLSLTSGVSIKENVVDGVVRCIEEPLTSGVSIKENVVNDIVPWIEEPLTSGVSINENVVDDVVTCSIENHPVVKRVRAFLLSGSQ